VSSRERKADHIRINLEEDVQFQGLTTGLEGYHFVHQALPELDLETVDTRVTVFGRELAAPILVSSMTGGTPEAGAINRRLAEAAQARGLAMGIGSQRVGVEDPETVATFQVREVAPDILLFANLGAVQLNYGYGPDQCRQAVEMVQADALILHLNPLQEAVQAGGDTNWHGLLARIEAVCRALSVPVVVKEVGWGISRQVARMLIEAGVAGIDVAGAGGTSWSQVEMHRAPTERLRRLAGAFMEWGIPTATTLRWVCQVRNEMGALGVEVFASGGIRTGQDVAKAVALGASLVGLASPFLKAAAQSTQAVVEEMAILEDELRVAMWCAGASCLEALRRPGVLLTKRELYG